MLKLIGDNTSEKIVRHSYAQQLADFTAACAWLSHCGVNVSPTRMGLYQRILSEIVEYHRAGKMDQLIAKRHFDTLTDVLLETSEVNEIHRGLASCETSEVTDSLRKFASGCTLLVEECRGGKNVARNIGFELDMTAAFKICEVPTTLGTAADIWIRLGGTPIAVECKRPFSQKALAANTNDGFRQLRRRYREHKSPSNVRGILALSVSKMLNQEARLLKGDNAADIKGSTTHISHAVSQEIERLLDNARDDRTVGVVACLRALSPTIDEDLFTVVRHFTWIGIPKSLADQQLFRRIAGTFVQLEAKNARLDCS